MQGCEICKEAPNLCWLIPAFSLLPFLSEDYGIISYLSMDLMVRNSRTAVGSCECEPRYEMHGCVLMTNLTFLLSCMKEIVVWSPCFPSCDVTEALFNGSFFCVCLALKDKKTLFSHWHATVCPWLTQRRNSQRHVDLLSLSSKKRSSSTSFSLIWSGLKSSAQWKLITLGLLLIVNSFGLFLKEFTKELIHYSFMCRCRL